MTLLGAWRARRALLRRPPSSPLPGRGSARLASLVDALGERLGSIQRIDDDVVHERRDGRLQLVGLDVGAMGDAELRERVLRVAHEMQLRHADAPRRRVVAVLLFADGDPRAHLERIADGGRADADWRAARRAVALVAVSDAGEPALAGGDHDVERAVRSACASARLPPSRRAARRS